MNPEFDKRIDICYFGALNYNGYIFKNILKKKLKTPLEHIQTYHRMIFDIS